MIDTKELLEASIVLHGTYNNGVTERRHRSYAHELPHLLDNGERNAFGTRVRGIYTAMKNKCDHVRTQDMGELAYKKPGLVLELGRSMLEPRDPSLIASTATATFELSWLNVQLRTDSGVIAVRSMIEVIDTCGKLCSVFHDLDMWEDAFDD